MSVTLITIDNCNSIEKAEVTISEGVLNIKYGPNGLGKSTISRAIVASVAKDGSLQTLKPFKYRALTGQHEPAVCGTENIGSVLVFDDAYVSQFVFQHDEVLKNSFDITAVRFNLAPSPSSSLPSMVYSDFRVSTI